MGCAERTAASVSGRAHSICVPLLFELGTPLEIQARVPLAVDCSYIEVCKAMGQGWFERTRAAKDPDFSHWVGEACEWETKAATEGQSSDADTLMGRVSLHVDAHTPGPFSANARRVLRGERPIVRRGLRDSRLRARLGNRRRSRGPQRRPGGRASRRCGTRTARGDPCDSDGDPDLAAGVAGSLRSSRAPGGWGDEALCSLRRIARAQAKRRRLLWLVLPCRSEPRTGR
jgi:hypothetical protein